MLGYSRIFLSKEKNKKINIIFSQLPKILSILGYLVLSKKLIIFNFWNCCKQSTSGSAYTPVPTIILKGQWLKEAGFTAGEYVEVECIDDKITLTKTTPPEAPKKSLEEKIEGLSESKRKKLAEFVDKL